MTTVHDPIAVGRTTIDPASIHPAIDLAGDAGLGVAPVERAAAPSLLPTGFHFGVSDSGFQSEGGYNGPGQPENNWAAWERDGVATPAGAANEFWTRYPEHLDKAAEIGLTTYRISVEWARCEPTGGALDLNAFEHYERILRAMRQRGIEPVVALHHFTHPSWLGADFWLRDDAPVLFERWVRRAVGFLHPYCRRWTTINEMNALGIGSYLIGYFPPGRRLRPSSMMRAVENMLIAHVKAYEAIHEIDPEAKVGASTYAFWCYDVDRLFVDLLGAPAAGVDRLEVDDWFDHRRRQFHDQALAGVSPAARPVEDAVHRALRTYLRTSRRLGRALDAVYSGRHERYEDVTQVNYYDPRLSRYAHVPGRRTGGRRHWGPDPEHWEQHPMPEHFANFLKANAVGPTDPGGSQVGTNEVWVLENGLCNPVVDGVAHPRPDGRDRPSYLRAHLNAVIDAVRDGVDVTTYCNWSLYDNYQWGEYESRFGLLGVDRTGEAPRFQELDSMGDDSAAALGRIIRGLRAGDRSVVRIPPR